MPGPTTAAAANPPRPAPTFLNLIVIILAQIFLPCCEGNLTNAQLLALETIQSYGRTRNRDLIAVAKIIAFDLAALAALSQSLAEDEIPIILALRLRQNALACDRVSERARKQLEAAVPKPAAAEPAEPPPVPEDERIHRTVLANAMLDVARQLPAEAVHISPALLKEAEIRANILKEAARTLLAGIPAPETPLPLSVTVNLPDLGAHPAC